MFNLFGKPGCSLKLGPQGAAWVEARRGWTGRAHPHYHMVEFPPGAVKPSPMEPNILDLPVVEARLKDLLPPPSSQTILRRIGVPELLRPIAMVVPDLATRMALLTVESMPDKWEEQEALVRWRLEQERLFPMAGTKVAFQAFGTTAKGAKGPRTVLAVVMRDTIWAQYDQLCERLGLSLTDLDLSSFRLWNLWRRGLSSADAIPIRQGLVWLNLLDGGMTIAIFKGGVPIFLRTKPIPPSRPGEVIPRIRTEYVLGELTSSLLYCQEQHPKLTLKHLFLIGQDLPPALGKDILQTCQLEVTVLGWAQAESMGWHQAFDHAPIELLEAVAGLAGAA